MSRPILITLVVSIVLLAGGVTGIAFYLFSRPDAIAQAQTAPATARGEVLNMAVYNLKNFVTDLADTDRVRYADVSIALGMKDGSGVEMVKKAESQIRDRILGHLRSRIASDLAGAPGKERLRDSLFGDLVKLLQGELKAVYITDLILQ